jgi:hypothetical protein
MNLFLSIRAKKWLLNYVYFKEISASRPLGSGLTELDVCVCYGRQLGLAVGAVVCGGRWQLVVPFNCF